MQTWKMLSLGIRKNTKEESISRCITKKKLLQEPIVLKIFRWKGIITKVKHFPWGFIRFCGSICFCFFTCMCFPGCQFFLKFSFLWVTLTKQKPKWNRLSSAQTKGWKWRFLSYIMYKFFGGERRAAPKNLCEF